MELTLKRRFKGEHYTIGSLSVDGQWLCDTLEDKDRGLSSTMALCEIKAKKVFGKTAIPTGTYRVELTYSAKFASRHWAKKYNGLVPEILGVKGFSGVRIHPGNKPEDTDGCPLVGENKVKGQVINSVETYYKLMDNFIMPAWNNKEEIYITIK